jgi:hypothetical protein
MLHDTRSQRQQQQQQHKHKHNNNNSIKESPEEGRMRDRAPPQPPIDD